MGKKLLSERIGRTEEKPFSEADILLLKTKRNKQFLFLLSGYLPFIAFGIYMLVMGPDSLNSGRHNDLRPYMQIKIDDEERSRFWIIAPYFFGFMFLILNIYFIKLYFQSLRPLILDIKSNKKQAIFFKPEKYPMAIFSKYYITTPLFSLQQMQITREDFENIGENDEVCLEIAPKSLFVLRFVNREREINIMNNYS